MIGKDQIAEAARYADARAEEHGLENYLRALDVDTEGMVYVAKQRGLRVVMMERGEDPNLIHATPVRLNATELRRQMLYAAIYMDGFAGGLTVKKDTE